jgi:hypothetical protein
VLKFPPNVTLRRDLIGLRLASWHALLQCLALVNLMQGQMNFNGVLKSKFPVNSMYRAKIAAHVQPLHVVQEARLLSPKIAAHVQPLHVVQEAGSLHDCMQSLAGSEAGSLQSPSAQPTAAREVGGPLAATRSGPLAPSPKWLGSTCNWCS